MTLKTLPLLLPAIGSSFLTHCRQDRNLSENTLSAYAQDLREFVLISLGIPKQSK